MQAKNPGFVNPFYPSSEETLRYPKLRNFSGNGCSSHIQFHRLNFQPLPFYLLSEKAD